MKIEKLPWLDWLRFCAALIVVMAHGRHFMFVKYSELSPESQNIFSSIFYAATKLGNEAVVLFFVISGYLVGGYTLTRIRSNNFLLKDYAIDRCTRILIPLIPALGLTIIINYIIGNTTNWLQILGHLLSLQNILTSPLKENEALWTLSYEVWLYILMGVMGLKGHFKTIPALLCVFIFWHLEYEYLIMWFIGAAAFLYTPNKSWQLFVVGLIICGYAVIGRQVSNGSESVNIIFLSTFVPSEEISRAMLAVGMALLIQQLRYIKPILPKAGEFLASFSYTTYLIHFPVLHGLIFIFGISKFIQVNIESMSLFMALTTLALCIAYVMYWIFERNTFKMRIFLKNKEAARPLRN